MALKGPPTSSLLFTFFILVNSELCSDNNVANTRCDRDKDCVRSFHCVGGFCCSRNCSNGSLSTGKCMHMKTCPPNHVCHRGQCCSLRMTKSATTKFCPDGQPARSKCDPMNKCSKGNECLNGVCCEFFFRPTAKAGYCPRVPTTLKKVHADHREDFCYSDAHCEYSRKCCRTIVGNRCLLPDTGFTNTFPEKSTNTVDSADRLLCPDGKRPRNACNGPLQCPKPGWACTGGACCPLDVVSSAVTASSSDSSSPCPTTVHPKQIRFAKACSSRLDCAQEQHCCKTILGHRCIRVPSRGEEKKNFCPRLFIAKRGNGGRQDQCNVDKDCEEGMRCCQLPVGKACLFSIEHAE